MSKRREVERAQSGLRIDTWIKAAATKKGDTSTADQAGARVRDAKSKLSKYN